MSNSKHAIISHLALPLISEILDQSKVKLYILKLLKFAIYPIEIPP